MSYFDQGQRKGWLSGMLDAEKILDNLVVTDIGNRDAIACAMKAIRERIYIVMGHTIRKD